MDQNHRKRGPDISSDKLLKPKTLEELMAQMDADQSISIADMVKRIERMRQRIELREVTTEFIHNYLLTIVFYLLFTAAGDKEFSTTRAFLAMMLATSIRELIKLRANRVT